jgi:hypothetical protein
LGLSDHSILIGACGWQYPQWDDSYYPEGLPEEWRLAYYGNEYPVVLIPAGYWAQGLRAIESWLQETDKSPGFICEWSFAHDKAVNGATLDLIDALGDRVKGVLCSVVGMPDEELLVKIDTLLKTYPVCMDWPNASPAQLQKLLSHPLLAQRVSICWHGEAGRKSDLDHGSLVLARVNSEGQTPRSLRTILETLLASTLDRDGVLLFDGHPPDLEIIDQAQVIMNLL